MSKATTLLQQRQIPKTTSRSCQHCDRQQVGNTLHTELHLVCLHPLIASELSEGALSLSPHACC
jgi:hypothetical protein